MLMTTPKQKEKREKGNFSSKFWGHQQNSTELNEKWK